MPAPLAPAPTAGALSGDALELLLEATRPDGSHSVVLVIEPGLASCTAGGRQFLDGDPDGELGRWEEAVRELVRAGHLRDPGPGGAIYEVTRAGAALADSYRHAPPVWPLGPPVPVRWSSGGSSIFPPPA